MVLFRPLVARVLCVGNWFKHHLQSKISGMSPRRNSTSFVTSVLATVAGLALFVAPSAAMAQPDSARIMLSQSPQVLQSNPTLAVAGGSMFHFSGDRPDNLGIVENHLRACPESPNCVSSQSSDSEHGIDPIRFEGNNRRAIQALKHAIDDSERAEVLKSSDNYIYAEFTSKLMGFVDDVEFYVNESEHNIEVRSASRMGESDLGVNRQRVEAIRQQFWALLESDFTDS